MSESVSSQEHEVTREKWLGDLAGFIIEAGQNGWAADAPMVENPQRPGFKELAYNSGDWEYRDSYAGYYMAPGSSVVYFKGRPVWYMTYGGDGQNPDSYPQAKETYVFLRRALMQPHPDLPVRGPARFVEETDGVVERAYNFAFSGDLANAKWEERITEWMTGNKHPRVGKVGRSFSQRGDVGLIIDKDENRQPIYPWNL